SPDRYRGKVVEFTGSLKFYERRKIPGKSVAPGMDFYYQCYLLDSNQIEYVFRTRDLPEEVKVNDIVHIKGYFLQRYNFLNRLNRTTWVPLIVVGDVEVMAEKSYGLTTNESRVVIALAVLFIGLIVVIMVSTMKKSTKPRRMKKELKFVDKPKEKKA
ncbi:MAG: hypothetical protein HQL32_14255, partial [Planctomycetes bacterium]|nr:hypothetical protein [Planctomycetota bacterium]